MYRAQEFRHLGNNESMDMRSQLTRTSVRALQMVRGPSGLTAMLKIANMALGMLTAILLVRTLGPENYGEYAYVYATVMILAVPAMLGLPDFVIRETAIAKSKDENSRIVALWKMAHKLVLITSTIIASAALIVIWLLGPGIASLESFMAGLVLIFLISLGNLRGAALRGLGHVVLGQLPDSLLRPLLFNIAIVSSMVYFKGIQFSAFDALLLHVTASFVAFLFGVYLLVRLSPTTGLARVVRPTKKAIITSSIALGAVTGLTTINNNIATIMLAQFRTATEVGLYAPVALVGILVMFGLQTVTTVIMPQVATLQSIGDLQALERLLVKSSRIPLAIALVMLGAIIIFGRMALSTLFGEAYAAGYFALVILATGQTVNAAFGPKAMLLNMSGYERYTLCSVGAAILLNLIMSVFLVNYFGLEGAALSMALSLIAHKSILLVVVRRKLGIKSSAVGL